MSTSSPYNPPIFSGDHDHDKLTHIHALGTWLKIGWVEKFLDYYTGMKFFNTCEYDSLIWLKLLPTKLKQERLIIFVFGLEGWGEIIFKVHSLQTCASSPACGICKFRFIAKFCYSCNSVSLERLLINVGAFHTYQWCSKQQFEWFDSWEYWELHLLPGFVCIWLKAYLKLESRLM